MHSPCAEARAASAPIHETADRNAALQNALKAPAVQRGALCLVPRSGPVDPFRRSLVSVTAARADTGAIRNLSDRCMF